MDLADFEIGIHSILALKSRQTWRADGRTSLSARLHTSSASDVKFSHLFECGCRGSENRSTFRDFFGQRSGKPIDHGFCVTRHLAAFSLVATLVGIIGVPGLHAQGVVDQEGGPAATFRSGIEAVTVTASVRDAKGHVVQTLTRGDFEVLDRGFSKEIKDFYTGESAISLAILLDISGSMGVGGNMDRAREAVRVVLAHLQKSGDEAAFYTFDSTLRQVVDFTSDLARIRAVSLAGRPWGPTSLFDAIGEMSRSASERANRHRAVLVITDGVDTGSAMTAREVSGLAASIDVPVYLLTVVNPLDHPGGEFSVIHAGGERAEIGTLLDLARWTGGDMRICSMPAHTAAAVDDLFAELRFQYLISFEPGFTPGWHPIEVRTRRKNLVVHARSGYLVTAPH